MFWNSLVSLKRPSKGRDFWNCARFGRGDAAIPHCTCGGSWDYCSASFLIWQLLLLQHNWQSKEEKILEVPLLYNDSRIFDLSAFNDTTETCHRTIKLTTATKSTVLCAQLCSAASSQAHIRLSLGCSSTAPTSHEDEGIWLICWSWGVPQSTDVDSL